MSGLLNLLAVSATLAVLILLLSPGEAHAQAEKKKPIRDEVSYTNDIRPVVNNFCTTCHAGDDPEGEFVLTSYKNVRKYTEKGKLLKRINDADEPMPQSGLMPLYMRRLFQKWADGGYVNVGKRKSTASSKKYAEFKPPLITPVDVSRQGFEMLEYMQGHWVGSMNLMGQDFDWMAFDYRAIAPSHVHGIFEGGTIGNLFTSFFVTKFKGRKTIMARNGGILNGIYRTSYFVLDKVQYGKDWAYYRLVDSYGGQGIMWMELTFSGNTLEWNSYTSRFGLTEPQLHMAFKGKQKHPELAAAAAKAVGFPENVAAFDFSKGLPKPNWSVKAPQTSASYIWEDKTKSILELGRIARDPVRVDQMPYLSQLKVTVKRTAATRGKKLHMYLSRRALTDGSGKFITQGGYIRLDLLDGLLSFPEVSGKQDEFTYTYLHPGRYFLTVVADMDADGYPSPGDISHPVMPIEVKPKSSSAVMIGNLTVKN
ncbi:MAG: hypothetical protein H8E37_04605 [Planctomycetes bacterium]|nr:hypothetical protein [Planctomycetota bacterium]